MLGQQQFIASFLSGLISFFAPCLLPLFPTYFSVITGFTFAEIYGLEFSRIRGRVFVSSLFFALGFSLVFTTLGATGSLIGRLLEAYLPLLSRISGFFLILLGLVQMGILRLPIFQYDYAWTVQRRLTRLGYVTAMATGIAAALSWIPCISPLLTPILLLATQTDTVSDGALLLFIYSLGLTSPFLIAGLSFPSIARKFQAHRRLFQILSVTAGLFLIAFGLLLLFDRYRLFIELINPQRLWKNYLSISLSS